MRLEIVRGDDWTRVYLGPYYVGATFAGPGCVEQAMLTVRALLTASSLGVTAWHKHDESGCAFTGDVHFNVGELFTGPDRRQKARWQAAMIAQRLPQLSEPRRLRRAVSLVEGTYGTLHMPSHEVRGGYYCDVDLPVSIAAAYYNESWLVADLLPYRKPGPARPYQLLLPLDPDQRQAAADAPH